MDIGARFRKSAFWIYLQSGGSALVSFGGGIAMARLLEPEDFGVFAAVTAYTALVAIQIQAGLPQALLRTSEDDMIAIDSAFWVMQGLAVLCCGGIVFAAPFLESVYGNPHYAMLMTLIALSFLLQPLVLAGTAVLTRSLRHDITSRITFASQMISVPVGVFAAASGLGVYSFAAGAFTGPLVWIALLLRYVKWRPRLRIDKTKTKHILTYGLKLHAGMTLTTAANRVDAMLIGRLAGLPALGIYNRALSTSRLPVTELLGRLYSLVFAAFARIEGQGNRSRKAFRKLTTAMTVPIYLGLAWLALCAEPFIRLLYGEKWLAAVPPMQILLLAAALATLRGLLSMYANATGLAGRQAMVAGMDLFATVSLVVLSLRWGLEGVAWAITARNLLLLLATAVIVLRRSHVHFADILSGTWPSVLCASAALGVGIAAPPPIFPLPLWAQDLFQLSWYGVLAVMTGTVTLFILYKTLPRHDGLNALAGLSRPVRDRMQAVVTRSGIA